MSRSQAALVVEAATLIAAVVVALLAFIASVRLQRRIVTVPSVGEWRNKARRLRWRDRYELWRANARGRATRPDLAPLAIERGEFVASLGERVRTAPGQMQRVLTAGALLVAAGFLVAAILGDGPFHRWANAALFTTLGLLRAGLARRQRAAQGRIRRSVEINRALLSGAPPPGGETA